MNLNSALWNKSLVVIACISGISSAHAADLINVSGVNDRASALTTGVYTVPAGVYWVDVQVKSGSGGGGGADNLGPGGTGGSGALITGTVAVNPGETIQYTVGNGGTGGQSLQYNAPPSVGGGKPGLGGAGAAKGGDGGANSSTGSGGGGGGGGVSFLQVGSTYILAGGGGGGAGGAERAPGGAGVAAGGSTLANALACQTPASGGTPVAIARDGGTGGGGGAGYQGATGAAGVSGFNNGAAATGGGAGGSCFFAAGSNSISGSLSIAPGGAGGKTVPSPFVYAASGDAGHIVVTHNTTLQSPKAPLVSLVCTPPTLTDSAGQEATCTVTVVPGERGGDVSVNLILPTSSGRYTTTCQTPLLIASPATQATCTISATANTVVDDGDVDAVLAIAPAASPDIYTVGTGSASVTIENDDTATPPTVIAPVPTLDHTALPILSLLAVVIGGFALRRRQCAGGRWR